MTIIKGKKINMSQIFLQDGKVIPVTILRSEENLESDLENKEIVLVGKSKGKGFTGAMATRGQSNKARAPGSIGAQTPGRVFKGKKMAGKHGNKRITLKGLKIVKVFPEKREFMVTGPVPGARNSKVLVEII